MKRSSTGCMGGAGAISTDGPTSSNTSGCIWPQHGTTASGSNRHPSGVVEGQAIALVGMVESHKAALARELARTVDRNLFNFRQALEAAIGVPFQVLQGLYTLHT